MAIQRRGFFRGLFATPVAAAARPLLRFLPASIAARLMPPKASIYGDLITATLRNRTPYLIEQITKTNAIMRHLQGMK